MTATSRLARRLDRAVGRLGAPKAAYCVDLHRLSGAEADRLLSVGRSVLEGVACADEAKELRMLLTRSVTMVSEVSIRQSFVVPRSLQIYWRVQKFADTGFSFPGGNYRFNTLSHVDREALVDICYCYGWDPDAEEISIAPLKGWVEEDRSHLFDLMWRSTSKSEREMWRRRDRC